MKYRPDRILLATTNVGKVLEFRDLLAPAGFDILTPKDIGFDAEVEETGTNFHADALLKARALSLATDLPVLSDDSGLEVNALGGAPGIYSARYAGPGCDMAQNRAKVLEGMKGAKDRTGRFICVLCYLEKGEEPRFFEGFCEGVLIGEERGGGGFGYDVLFIPEGYDKTFGELSEAVKAGISHRAKAVDGFLRHLEGA